MGRELSHHESDVIKPRFTSTRRLCASNDQECAAFEAIELPKSHTLSSATTAYESEKIQTAASSGLQGPTTDMRPSTSSSPRLQSTPSKSLSLSTTASTSIPSPYYKCRIPAPDRPAITPSDRCRTQPRQSYRPPRLISLHRSRDSESRGPLLSSLPGAKATSTPSPPSSPAAPSPSPPPSGKAMASFTAPPGFANPSLSAFSSPSAPTSTHRMPLDRNPSSRPSSPTTSPTLTCGRIRLRTTCP